MNKLLMIVLALQLAGCATARTLNAAKPGAPLVYGDATGFVRHEWRVLCDGSFWGRGAELSWR